MPGHSLTASALTADILPAGHQVSGARQALATARAKQRHTLRRGIVERSALMPWVPVAMSLGIALWFALRIEPGRSSYGSAALIFGGGLFLYGRASHWAETGRLSWGWCDGLRLAGAGLALAAVGFLLCGLRAASVDAPILNYRFYGEITGRVHGVDRSARDRIRVTITDPSLQGIAADETPTRIRLSLSGDDSAPPVGATVRVTGHLGPPPGPAEPGGYDFRRAAYFNQLGAIGYTRNHFDIIAPPAPGLAERVVRLRLSLGQHLRTAIGGQEGAVAAALMTGDRSGIVEATNQLMRDANLYHIVSISGLHMSMLAAFIYAALRGGMVGIQVAGLIPLGWPVHKLAAIGALISAAGYLALAGAEVATTRAFIMVAVMLLAIIADRRAISLRTVALAAVLILSITPEALVTPGFQMSFAATVALVVASGPWSRIAAQWPWIIRAPVLLVISSLIAGLATGPIAAAHFGRSSTYGLIANLAAVPVMGSVVMPAGVVAAILGPLGLGAPAYWAMGLGTRWMLWVAEWVVQLPGAVSAVRLPPAPSLPLLVIGAVVVILSVGWARWRLWARLLGGLSMIAAVLTWQVSKRPDILISPEGAAVGVMTPDGRALSKPAGAFVVASWAEGDGEVITVEDAAARPGWRGALNQRETDFAGRRLFHITGKGAEERARAACRDGAILVVNQRVKPLPGQRADCMMLDLWRLRRTGAVAISAAGEHIGITTDAQLTGNRRWSMRLRDWTFQTR